MRTLFCWLAAAAGVVGASTAVGAQENRCVVAFDSVGTYAQTNRPDGSRLERMGGGVYAHCIGTATRMRADSVEWFSMRDRVDLFGAVHFEDSAVTLDADRATYFLSTERLEAYQNVRLENLETGSVLTGPMLNYERAVPGLRDTTELFARGRPTVEYRDAGQPDQEPYSIIGNQVRLRGNDQAWAGGSVTIDRSDFHAKGDSAELDLGADRGDLLGHARVEGGDSAAYVVGGDEVGFTLENGALNWVQARASAEAESADWRVVADTIEFFLEDERIRGGIAWGDQRRPMASSSFQTIVADSLAIDTPDQVLEQVRGFGMARATSVRDSVDTDSDWVAGDTVVVQFDSLDTGSRFLSALNAFGTAQAYYRVIDLETGGDPDLSYSRGQRILASFGPLGIERVDVVGEADGIHLVPAGRRPQ